MVVLAFDGQDALRHETADPPARCMVNPLHGTAERAVRTILPDLPQAKRPLCEACLRESDRRPLTLEIEGRERPYYQAPGLWEKIRGRTRDLPERVLEALIQARGRAAAVLLRPAARRGHDHGALACAGDAPEARRTGLRRVRQGGR